MQFSKMDTDEREGLIRTLEKSKLVFDDLIDAIRNDDEKKAEEALYDLEVLDIELGDVT